VVFALNRRLVFFRRQDLTEIGTLALPADGGEVASLIRCGSKGFALRDNARIYIVDPVPDT
jgi:hypothetical protein